MDQKSVWVLRYIALPVWKRAFLSNHERKEGYVDSEHAFVKTFKVPPLRNNVTQVWGNMRHVFHKFMKDPIPEDPYEARDEITKLYPHGAKFNFVGHLEECNIREGESRFEYDEEMCLHTFDAYKMGDYYSTIMDEIQYEWGIHAQYGKVRFEDPVQGTLYTLAWEDLMKIFNNLVINTAEYGSPYLDPFNPKEPLCWIKPENRRKPFILKDIGTADRATEKRRKAGMLVDWRIQSLQDRMNRTEWNKKLCNWVSSQGRIDIVEWLWIEEQCQGTLNSLFEHPSESIGRLYRHLHTWFAELPYGPNRFKNIEEEPTYTVGSNTWMNGEPYHSMMENPEGFE